MEKKIKFVLLYETYKPMLTKNMQNVFEQYYFSDLSLREIGENNKVSFQAVRDTLKKSEKELIDLESKLNVLKLKTKIQNIVEYISYPNMDIEMLKKEIRKLGEI